MNWSAFLLFLLNWDWFDLIRANYSSVSCPNFCCHSCTTLIKVAWIRVGKISKHEVYNMKELRKSKKWHETLKCSNQFKKTQNQLKQIESWPGCFFLPTKPCLAPSESSGIMLTVVCILVRTASFPRSWRNHSWCTKKWYLIWMGCFFHWDEAKKNGRLRKKPAVIFLK